MHQQPEHTVPPRAKLDSVGLDSVVSTVGERLLADAFPVLVISLLVMTAVVIMEVVAGRATCLLLGAPICLLIALVAARRKGALGPRAIGLSACLSILSVIALFHFGPLAGTGIFMTGAVLSWSFVVGGRGAVGAVAGFFVAVVAAAVASRYGWGPDRFVTASSSEWLRLSLSTTVGLAGTGFLFHRVQGNMQSALAEEIAARAIERRAALDAQRLESVGLLASGVAHDFNNALAVIQGSLDLLADAPKEERDVLIRDALAMVASAKLTTTQLLSLAQDSTEEDGSSQAHEVLVTVARSARRVLPATISLHLDAKPGPWVAMPGPVLAQVITNLLVNARDSIPGLGAIKLGCRPDDAGVAIDVEDTGSGMTDEVQLRLFDPFFTTKAKGAGTGLGLTMVKHLTEKCGGSVEVASQVGRGTRFTLRLPATTSPSQPHPRMESSAELLAVRILVVEDDALVRRTLERVLRRSGRDFTSVPSVAEARIALTKERFGLLITDGVLEDGHAPDVIDAFRRSHPKGPVLLCTGYLDKVDALRSKDVGHIVVLKKPFAAKDLEAKVSTLLGAASRPEPAISTAEYS